MTMSTRDLGTVLARNTYRKANYHLPASLIRGLRLCRLTLGLGGHATIGRASCHSGGGKENGEPDAEDVRIPGDASYIAAFAEKR